MCAAALPKWFGSAVKPESRPLAKVLARKSHLRLRLCLRGTRKQSLLRLHRKPRTACVVGKYQLSMKESVIEVELWHMLVPSSPCVPAKKIVCPFTQPLSMALYSADLKHHDALSAVFQLTTSDGTRARSRLVPC